MIKLYSLFQTAVSWRISQWNLWKQEALREHTPPPIFIFKGIFIYIHLIFFHIFNMLSDVCSKDVSKCRLVLFTRGRKQHFNRLLSWQCQCCECFHVGPCLLWWTLCMCVCVPACVHVCVLAMHEVNALIIKHRSSLRTLGISGFCWLIDHLWSSQIKPAGYELLFDQQVTQIFVHTEIC